MVQFKGQLIWLVALFLFLATLSAPVSTWAQETRTHSLSVQFYRAETAWRTGANMIEAKIRLDNVLEELPDDVAARKLRAQVLLDLGRISEALADARHAAELAPSDPEARLILAEAARISGEREEAVEELRAAAEHVLDDSGMHLRLSWNALLLGQLHQAEAYARTALALNPTDIGFYHLARVFLYQDEPDQAAAMLRRGFQKNMVESHIVQRDSLLSQVSDHELLREFMPDN